MARECHMDVAGVLNVWEKDSCTSVVQAGRELLHLRSQKAQGREESLVTRQHTSLAVPNGPFLPGQRDKPLAGK